MIYEIIGATFTLATVGEVPCDSKAGAIAARFGMLRRVIRS
jgi:hypothetical protein